MLGTLKRSAIPASVTGSCAPHLLEQLDCVAVRDSFLNAQDLFQASLQKRHFLNAGSGAKRKIARMELHMTFDDADGRTLCWIYVRGDHVSDYKVLSDQEAQMLAKAIARLSRRSE